MAQSTSPDTSPDTLPNTWADFQTMSKGMPTILTIIKCGAVWCAPCKEVMPFVNYLKDNYPTVKIFDLNIKDDTYDLLTMALPIVKIPTFIFIKNGIIVDNILYSPSTREDDKGKIETCIVDNL
uniref:Thioredoxin domain-containing protein n=1 Tax=viral metagenome TaxID=1070528 RepID=A0A6C0HLF3_9ZZZZ